jgi:hypothetical protein
MEIPAEFVEKQLKRMESPPTYNLACLLGIGLSVGLSLATHRLSPCCGAGLVICVIGFLASGYQYRRSCLNQPGWLAALVRFHVVAVVMMALMLSTPVLVWNLGKRIWMNQPIAMVAAVFIALLLVFLIVSWLHRLAKAPMERLQREVAVEAAREFLRRTMARNGNGQ